MPSRPANRCFDARLRPKKSRNARFGASRPRLEQSARDARRRVVGRDSTAETLSSEAAEFLGAIPMQPGVPEGMLSSQQQPSRGARKVGNETCVLICQRVRSDSDLWQASFSVAFWLVGLPRQRRFCIFQARRHHPCLLHPCRRQAPCYRSTSETMQGRGVPAAVESDRPPGTERGPWQHRDERSLGL
jgi:hypothetical protein